MNVASERTEWRRRQVKSLLEEGLSLADIAARLGYAERTIYRDRRRLGMSTPWEHQWTEKELSLAESLLRDGCSYAEVSRTLGIGVEVIKRRFPGMGQRAMRTLLGNGHHLRMAEDLGLRLT